MPSDEMNDGMLEFRDDDDPQSYFFEMLDYESRSIIKNLGSMFFMLILNILLTLVVLVLTRLCRDKEGKCK